MPYTRRPRARQQRVPSFHIDDFLRELDVIVHRVERVAAVPASSFCANCPEYDAACMAISRLAAFLERDEYSPDMAALTSAEKRALRTTRNVAAHSGYRSMDDELLWTAVARDVPDMIERLREAARGCADSAE